MKPKNQNFHTLKVNNFNCFFSQVREVSHSTLHKREITQSEISNCFVAYESDEIFIISRGGTKFHLPMDQEVNRVYPLIEGILIQFFVKPEIKLQEILYYQKHKNNMDMEDLYNTDLSLQKQKGRYCYATLNRHPYNPLKMLGQFNNQDLLPWFKVKESINFVSPTLPLMISYNEELLRNAFHVLLANISDVKRQYQFAFIPTHTYSLKNVGQSPHFQVLSQTIFEESSQGEKIVKVILNKSVKRGHAFVYAQTVLNEIKVFEIDFYGSNSSTRLISKILNATCMMEADLYTKNMFIPETYKTNDCQLLNEILKEQLNNLPDSVLIVHQNQIGYYHNGHLVRAQNLDKKFVLPMRIQGQTLVDANNQQCLISPLISNPIDSIILKSTQLGLDDEKAFTKCLINYCQTNGTISEALMKLHEQKSNAFFLLHLLYQEFKLYELMKEERQKLATIILQIAQKYGKNSYVDYYSREGYEVENVGHSKKIQSLQIQQIYDIYQILNKILNKSNNIKQLFSLYNRSKFVITFFQLLVEGETIQTVEHYSRDTQLNSKYQHGKQHFFKNRFPLLSQKIFHIDYYMTLYESQLLSEARPENKEQKAFIYLIKNNQSQNQIITYPQSIRATFNWLLRQMRRELPYSLYEVIPKLGFLLIQRQDLYKNIQLYKRKSLTTPYHLQKPSLDDHIKTLVHTSTSQEYFLTSNASEMNKINNDLVFDEVDRLLSSTSEIKIKIKDIESIPQDRWEIQSQNILLKFANRKLAIIIGQGAFNLGTSRSFITDVIKIPKINLSGVMPNDIKITLDLKEDKEAIIYWPQFHSGMAAGLRLSRHVIPLSEDHLKTWIFYQKPDTPKRDHSGFLLSLGLLGYLKCFSPTDIYQYLKPNNQFTSVAILLGVSASNIGKSDEALSKALILHIPVLLPPSIDVQIPINVQTSALIGIGLLHKGTCNRTMTEMTLSQIGKRPSSDKCLDRQGYSLAAGWSLGMICLGMKDKKQSFRDLQLQERLIRFIQGGKNIDPPQSMISTNYINESKCSSIKEGANVNLHITAPAALLAISLMYLKSNDAELASKITIPNSFNTIQQCNPNHILFKTVAKNLIMWDKIENSKEFILNQIPELIRFIYENSLSKVYQRYYLVYNVSEIDYQTITTIYVSVMTGAIIAMAFKFAGTGNLSVVRTIKEHIEHLKNVKIIKCQFANDPLNKNSIDQYELFSLLSTSLLALSIVMAGSCDIECLKIIRIIRKKFQDSKVFHYGFSMAINMAIGFIFLGYGNYTFNREDMSIAALLISIFPQFPNSPSDNKWHLQALRHFYVLAMEEKIFHAVDVDTNKVVNVNAKMTFLMEGQFVHEQLHTPILLQESKKLTHIKIRDEDYFDVDFAFDDHCKTEPKAIYIKRKHFKDINPQLLNPQNSLSTGIMHKTIKDSLRQEVRFTGLFGLQQKKISLSYLLPSISPNKQTLIASKMRGPELPNQLYYKLLKEDRLEVLQIYLTLQKELKAISNNLSKDSLALSNVLFLLNFQKWQGSAEFSSIVGQELTHLRNLILQKTAEGDSLLKKYLLAPHQAKLPKISVYKMLRVLQVPTSRDLLIIKNAIEIMKKKSEKPEHIQMMLLMSYPECSIQILNHILQTYLHNK